MVPLSTAEVAGLVEIHRVTLEEWLRLGKVKPPKKIRIGGQVYRLWTEADVERLRKYKKQFYRKGRGRKKKVTHC
jgi:DNA-binding transcriptional MerR regulator